MQGVHKIIQSASRLAQTLGDHSRPAGAENLHVGIGSLIRDVEPNKKSDRNGEDEHENVVKTGILLLLILCLLRPVYRSFIYSPEVMLFPSLFLKGAS